MRMRLLPQLAALLLGAAAAYLVACGGDDNLIPPSDASRVDNALDEVAADYRAGRCQAAEAALAKARGALLNLPSSVDERLRDRLRSGVANLGERVPKTCGGTQSQTQQQTQTQETQTGTTETTTTETDTGTTGTGTTGTGTTGTGTTGTTGTGMAGTTGGGGTVTSPTGGATP